MSEPVRLSLPLAFDLLWPRAGSERAKPAPGEWQALASAAHEHRLRPLLHAARPGWPWQPPEALAEDWSAAHRASAKRALLRQAELVRLGRRMGEAGIRASVLKGGAIAWRGWFDPALRPMRDLDLFVAEGRAAEAQDLLRAGGYQETGQRVAGDKHMPGLTAPQAPLLVEIHDHLITPSGPVSAARDRAFCDAVLARAVPLPGSAAPLLTLSDGDTLLHVIIHGALDHQFNNGPLLIFDVLALLRQGTIDWPVFWATADLADATRAAQLVLAFAQALAPQAAIDWLGNAPRAIDPRMLESVAEMMLVERRHRRLAGVTARLARLNWRDRVSELGHGLTRMISRQGDAFGPGASESAAGLDLRQFRAGLRVSRWLRAAQ